MLHFHNSDPNGIRTRATAVKGQRPRPLNDGARTYIVAQLKKVVKTLMKEKSWKDSFPIIGRDDKPTFTGVGDWDHYLF